MEKFGQLKALIALMNIVERFSHCSREMIIDND